MNTLLPPSETFKISHFTRKIPFSGYLINNGYPTQYPCLCLINDEDEISLYLFKNKKKEVFFKKKYNEKVNVCISPDKCFLFIGYGKKIDIISTNLSYLKDDNIRGSLLFKDDISNFCITEKYIILLNNKENKIKILEMLFDGKSINSYKPRCIIYLENLIDSDDKYSNIQCNDEILILDNDIFNFHEILKGKYTSSLIASLNIPSSLHQKWEFDGRFLTKNLDGNIYEFNLDTLAFEEFNLGFKKMIRVEDFIILFYDYGFKIIKDEKENNILLYNLENIDKIDFYREILYIYKNEEVVLMHIKTSRRDIEEKTQDLHQYIREKEGLFVKRTNILELINYPRFVSRKVYDNDPLDGTKEYEFWYDKDKRIPEEINEKLNLGLN